MSAENKISQTPVWKYMDVINNPKQYASSKPVSLEYAILDKFRAATKSHLYYRAANGWESTEWIINHPRDISFAWGSFNAILVIFQYLNDDKKDIQNVLSLSELFRHYNEDPKVNEPQHSSKISAGNANRFVFRVEKYEFTHTAATFKAKVVVQGTDNSPEAYKANFDFITAGCTKGSTIDDVIRCLEPHVRPEAMAGFREMARRGFDVDFSFVPGPLWKKCGQLYDAGARQTIFTGAPGTGKTYTANQFAKHVVEGYFGNRNHLKNHIEIVQFHSSYDYSDFVEGLRPVETDETSEVTFRRLDGQFKAFCRKILENKDHNAPYFFIIDEINRADLSRVFGELMFCLDESMRPVSLADIDGKSVATQYSMLPAYEVNKDTGKAKRIDNDIFHTHFFIPKNLCILATMNDIDRSVETFDFALRRRFKWIEATANDEMECGLRGMLKDKVSEEKIASLIDNAKAMNSVIFKVENSEKPGAVNDNFGGKYLHLTADYHIGHAYFEKFNGENLQDIWDTQIEQILREYCRGRSNASQVEEFINNCHDALFGNIKKN